MVRLHDIVKWFVTAFRRPTLTNHLPPIPLRASTETTHGLAATPSAEERAEQMLLEIMRAPLEYVNAAILVAKATNVLHKRGYEVHTEGFVVFALSRMLPDVDGTIPVKRLRERLSDAHKVRSLIPTLLRLEEQGVIAFEAETTGDAAGISRFKRLDDVRIRLVKMP
jgi:hypothetical protein